MEFELKYELDNFKEVQDQYFDEDNKCYTGVNLSTDIMEKMLSLIDNLSERVNELEPVIKQQIKKSLPIHGVVVSFYCGAEHNGGSLCETQCLGCDGFDRECNNALCMASF